MEIKIEEDKKQDILKDFINTKKRIGTIADDNKLSVDHVMLILEEFKARGIIDARRYERLSTQIEEKIYDLRKDGMSYEQISSELGICIEIITAVIKNIFEEKNQEDPQDDCLKKSLSKDEIIYNLRKQKKGYTAIAKETGISHTTVRKKCKEIFKLRKEEEPVAETKRKVVTENCKQMYEEIYDLKKQKKSYTQIVEETGLSQYKVRKACKETFGGEGEEIPKAFYKKKQTEESKEIDQVIYNLVQEGKKQLEVKDILYKNGIVMSKQRISKRYKREFNLNQKKLANMILNLMITKKATLEQVQAIADYYGVNLEETMDSLNER